MRFLALFRSFSLQNVFLRTFRSKTQKSGMGPEPYCRQCFFSTFGLHFRKKAKKGSFCGFGAVFRFCAQNSAFFAPKLENRKSAGKLENCPSRNVTIVVPNLVRPFFAVLAHFSVWGVLGAKSGPEAENGGNFAFLRPKAEKSHFCDSGPENVPRTLRL